MTPSLPALSIASAMSSPIAGSAAEMEAVEAICSRLSTLGHGQQLGGDALDGGLDAPLQGHRVGAGGDVAQALADQRLGQHGGGGGAVARDVVGLLGDFLDELGPDLLVRVLELDLLGDGDTVVGDRGGAPLLLQHDVAPARAQSHLHGVSELVHAPLEATTSLFIEGDDLSHIGTVLPQVWTSQAVWTPATAGA
jgi:hypothetical protein